ncbi:hypothetical protein M3P21_11395 [Ruegeria sp. 2012CJ41-6]|uniref:DUF2497 domain-containing protein n=1 Tax=Ruegeria spongiae TaxID=2942209 RepID=A0ABT0Q2S1_9RHOB|nr:hypothetical protein [Ruegeria spongiae]MCL6284130.1 hypothetical protein [Ruegeria spongiae]
MSNQAANMGIEDVLSSIKKLVSNEGAPEPRPAAPRRPKKANKLVLTPALRVMESAPEADRRALPERASAVPWKNPKTTLYEAQAAGSAEVETRPSKPRPMLLRPEDAVPNDKVAWIRPEVARDDLRGDESSADDFAFHGKESAASAIAESVAEPLSKKIEALEAAIARTIDQWEPDGTTDEEYSGTKVGSGIAWQGRAPEKGAAAQVEIAAGSVVEPAADETAQDRADPAAPEVSAPQEMQAGRAPHSAAQTQQTPLASKEAVLDQDSLRAMVSDIVRQELQGVLGERITRNVRKLVRREIHRALTARDLE